MKNLKRVLAMGITSLVSLSGCSPDKKNAIQSIQSSLLQKAVDENLFDGQTDNLDLSFVSYKFDEDANDTNNLDLHAKVTDKNGYNSFLNVNYTQIPEKYFDASTVTANENAIDYKIIENIVSSNLPCTYANYKVESFDSINKTFEKVVPNTNQNEHQLDSLSVNSISNLKYDSEKLKASFDVDIIAKYKYNATSFIKFGTIFRSPLVIPFPKTKYDKEKVNISVNYFIDKVEYENNIGNSEFVIGKFQQYVKNKDTEKFTTHLKTNEKQAQNSTNIKTEIEEFEMIKR